MTFPVLNAARRACALAMPFLVGVGLSQFVVAAEPTEAQRAAKAAAAKAQMPQIRVGAEVLGGPVTPTATVPARSLPILAEWKPGDPIKEIPKRREWVPEPMAPVNPTTWTQDPLLDLQKAATANLGPSRAFQTPFLNFAPQPFNGSTPPDTVGEVGLNHYVHMINGAGGTAVRIFNKAGNLVSGPFALDTLSPGGACSDGLGDPIPVYDELADRWVLTEFSGGGDVLCVYVSQTPDPTGAYHAYTFNTPNFPDYPKYAVWPDAYYVGTNETGPSPVYALDRDNMLTGAVARPPQRFTAPSLAAFGFQILQPADLDGAPPPPAGTPGIFMRHRDDEAHNPGTNDPAQDFLEIWQLGVDWDTPGNSFFVGPGNIPIAEIDSELCGFVSFNCFQQPNGQRLDPLRELVMWRLQYRNFGTHQTLVGNLTTDVDDTDHGGIRWFELRNNGAGWVLHQEGTYAPDGDSRWMGSIAMNGQGDIAVGYSVASPTQSADIRYAGRKASDPPGTLPQGEETLIAGTGSWGAERWGDYSAMSVDPADDCTFWYTHMHADGNNQWGLRLGAFAMEGCAAPSNCGNSTLDGGEQCDDGNGAGGDGCSATCQVEDGFVCTDPTPPTPNVIADPSFEGGSPNATWTEMSTNFGTPLCDPNSCNPTFTASNGDWFAWFGGIPQFEQGSLEQTLTIPVGATTLEFDLHVQACDSANDFFEVRVDGNTLFTTNPCMAGPGYSRQTVDVSGFADGGNHTLLLESVSNATNGGVSNFFVDNLSLTGAGLPSMCMPDGGGGDRCFEENFDNGLADLGDWIRFNTGPLNLDWGTTDDGFCGSVNGTPGNHTGGAAEAACIDSDAAGNGVVGAFLCSPQFTVGSPTSELDFVYNYQVFSATGEDAFEVGIGTATPSPATIGSYTVLLANDTNQGTFQSPPGVGANLDLSAFAGQDVHICFFYGADFDWYAQVDDIVVGGCSASPDSDNDGVPDNEDNCIFVPNGPLIPDAGGNSQLDTDGDNIGNACDADIFPPGGGDCNVNFGDLATLKQAFFPVNNAIADFNGDGSVNFGDLAFMKSTFFDGANPGPGPSGLPNACDP